MLFHLSGGPISNTSLILLNSELKPIAKEEVGELFVGGLNNAIGYVGGAQKEKFIKKQLDSNSGRIIT